MDVYISDFLRSHERERLTGPTEREEEEERNRERLFFA
jgi:hypothetical protein